MLRAQNLLREQSKTSFNVLGTLLQFADALVPPRLTDPSTVHPSVVEHSEHYIGLLSRALDAVTEAVQGPCVGNQRVIMEGQGLETLRSVMSLELPLANIAVERPADWRDRLNDLGEHRSLFSAATGLLLSLLEGASLSWLFACCCVLILCAQDRPKHSIPSCL